MKKVLIYLKSIGTIFVSLFIATLIVTLLQYFNMNSKIVSFLKILFLILSIIIGSIMLGRNTNKKGYIEGLKLGSILIILFLLSKLLISPSSFQVRNIIYYVIILITSIVGSMLGIQKKLQK